MKVLRTTGVKTELLIPGVYMIIALRPGFLASLCSIGFAPSRPSCLYIESVVLIANSQRLKAVFREGDDNRKVGQVATDTEGMSYLAVYICYGIKRE
jgi:hypothetical protein